MTQISFDSLKPTYKITKPIRLIELFAGIGAQAKALENLGVDFEHYRICEFDKFAVQSYNAIHGTDFSTSDITRIGGGRFRNCRCRQVHLHNDLLVPLSRLIYLRQAKRNEQRRKYSKRSVVGSQTVTQRG